MISLKVKGLLEQLRALEMAHRAAASASGRAPDEAVKLVAGVDVKQNQVTFKTEGEQSGSKWAPLSPGYAKEKRAAVGRKTILIRTGEMRKSLVNESDGAHIARANGKLIEVGTRHPLAAKHQNGGRFVEQVPAHTRKVKRRVSQRRDAASGRFGVNAFSTSRGTGKGVSGKGVVKSSGFVYVRAHKKVTNLPARPVVRKSGRQRLQLLLAFRKGIYKFISASSSRGVARAFLTKAGQITPDPRL